MGTYSTMILNINLIKDTPDEFIGIINFLCSGFEDKFIKPFELELELFKDHQFFKCSRWRDVGSVIEYHYRFGKWGLSGKSSKLVKNEDGSYNFKSISVIKNYNEELENFLDFIYPYTNYDKNVYGWFMSDGCDYIFEIIKSTNENNFKFRGTNFEDLDEIEEGPFKWLN